MFKLSSQKHKTHTWFRVSGLCSKILIFILWPMFFISCISQKQLTYLNDINESGSENFFPLQQPEYRLQKQDILYVKFNTLNEDINTSLNGGANLNIQNMYQSEVGIYVSGFAINDSGYINLPLIGKVSVLGKTMVEATSAIIEKTSLFVKDASVNVKLLSFRFTILGEVNVPGHYTNYKNHLTVLEAIGMAGDITDFGDRSNILVLRSTISGTQTFRLNLYKKDNLSSKDFFLVPNDMVIVQPLQHKSFMLNASVFSFFLNTLVSSLSLTLLILTVL
jgi:polysaccharide export outer membrane protein